MRTLRTLLINSTLVIASALVFLLLLEGGLRIAGYQMREARVLCLDPIVGNVYCPNLTTPLRTFNDAGDLIDVSFNSEGMADREYARSKPGGTIRIALFGDSVSASLYTPADRKFKSYWEAGIAKQLGRPVEILNFGVDGQGTWEELQMFHLKGRHFQPDYAIVAFYWGNDISNNGASKAKDRPNPLLDEYAEPTGLRNFQVKHRYAIRWMWNHSAAYQFLDVLKETLEQSAAYRAGDKKENVSSELNRLGAATEVVYDAGFSWDSEAWELTRQLFTKFKREADEAGVKLIVFHLPMLDQITKPKPLPYKQFRSFLSAQGIVSVDAFDELERLSVPEKTALYLKDTWHLSSRGHRFFADATLPKLLPAVSPMPTR